MTLSLTTINKLWKLSKIFFGIMKISHYCLVFTIFFADVFSASDPNPKLQIGVKKRAENCNKKSKRGDMLEIQYTGRFEDGIEFDSSLPRGEPLTFTLGSGQVIKGWDQGLVGMCEGEKRKLIIPSSLGYGDSGAPPRIPGGATLLFDVELVKIHDRDDRNNEL